MQSPRYSLNKEDLIKIGMAMVYSGTAAALAYLAATIDQVNVPAQYMVFVPVMNAMIYSVVRFLEGKSQV